MLVTIMMKGGWVAQNSIVNEVSTNKSQNDPVSSLKVRTSALLIDPIPKIIVPV